ncbi:recombinase family protein [Duodenibacillus massiliensis]|uniref:recombinase family protein n=1 Tax=Duodenibacillus massiliensis TaxID=1852381 RepID=UPI003AB3C43A
MGSSAKIGYVRVSTVEQNTARQLVGITLDRVFEEKVSAKNNGNRPVLREMLGFIRDGDDLYVHSMDRLARNLKDLLTLVTTITDKGVTLHFVKENLTFEAKAKATPFNKLLLGLLGSVAEFERELILERQREGIAQAKARGAYKGRKPIAPEKIEKAKELLAQGMTRTEAAKTVGMGRTTLFLYLKNNGQAQAKQAI